MSAGDPYTGEELYKTYRERMDELGVEVDEWKDLEDRDRDAWDFVAKMHTGA